MGRLRGSVNREKLEFRDRLRRYMKDRNIDPHYFMIDLIADDSTQLVPNSKGEMVEVPAVPLDLKFQAAREVAQYLEPKLRSMEVSGASTHIREVQVHWEALPAHVPDQGELDLGLN